MQHVSIRRTFPSGTIKRYHGTLISQDHNIVTYRDAAGIEHRISIANTENMTNEVFIVDEVASA